MTPPDRQVLNNLAQEVAMRYWRPEEVAQRFGVDVEFLKSLQKLPEFNALVLKAQRDIDEQGTKTKLAARKIVAELIPIMGRIAGDPAFPTGERINAFKELTKIAGLDATPQGGNNAFVVNIQMNNH